MGTCRPYGLKKYLNFKAQTNALKRITSILLITLLLFNWLGYKIVLNFLQQRADNHLEARIDSRDYNDEDLIEIRVALNVPYQAVNTSFERHYGEIEIDGQFYTYVKRRVEDGMLVLKCIPNHQKEKLQNTANTIFKANNGLDQPTGNNASPFVKLIKCLAGDFDNDKQLFQLVTPHLRNKTQHAFTAAAMRSGFATTAERPPQFIAG